MPDEFRDMFLEFEDEEETVEDRGSAVEDADGDTVGDEFEFPEEVPARREERTPAVSGIVRDSMFGVGVGVVMPASGEYASGFGFGFLYDLRLSPDERIGFGVHSASISNEDDSDISTSLLTVKGDYLRYFGSFFIGGGGGLGQAVYSGIDESSEFAFAEFKTGYGITPTSRIEVRFLIPLNTEDSTLTGAVGYEYLF
jgi:hypothetical protein